MSVVFDTNIFVSGLTYPGGRGELALHRIIEGDDTLLISKPIIHEVIDVLARKFSRDQEELARVAVYLSDIATLVYPRQKIDILKDEPDNRILECAVAGKAGVIVTGDREMLRLGEYKTIGIISLKEYLKTP